MSFEDAPLISVVMTVYNRQEYVRDAITSILEQTWSNLEVIVVDDGSTDESARVVEALAGLDSRVKLIRQDNAGIANAAAAGLRCSSGDWVVRMDSDDIALPNRLEQQFSWMQRTGADICGTWMQCFDGSTIVIRYPVEHETCGFQMLFDVPVANPTVMCKSVVFRELKYDPHFILAEDYDLWQRAWVAGYKFTNVPQALLKYRVHKGQFTSQKLNLVDKYASEIRLRQWNCLLPANQRDAAVDIVLAIGRGEVNLKPLVPVFIDIFRCVRNKESLNVLLFNYFRVFCKSTSSNNNISGIWIDMTRAMQMKPGIFKVATLFFLNIFRFAPDNCIFRFLKNTYLTARSKWIS